MMNREFEELRSELANSRLGHEILESLDSSRAPRDPGSDSSKLAAFVADLILDLYDSDSSGSQNKLRLTTNLEMAADRLTALASQLRARSSNGNPEALALGDRLGRALGRG